MSRVLYGFTTSGTPALQSYDLDAGTYVSSYPALPTLVQFPIGQVTNSWFVFMPSLGNSAYDGKYLYALLTASNNGSQGAAIVRLNPGVDASWAQMLLSNSGRGGVNNTIGSQVYGMVTDGTYIYFCVTGTLYRYNIAADSVTTVGALSAFNANFTTNLDGGQMVYDGVRYVYIVGLSQSSSYTTVVYQYDTVTGTVTLLGQTSPPSQVQGAFFYNGSLWVYAITGGGTQISFYQATFTSSTQISWGLFFNYRSPDTGITGGVMVNTTQIAAAITNGTTSTCVLLDMVAESGANVNTGSPFLQNLALNTPLNPSLIWLEADGLTPIGSPEPLGGVGATWVPGAQSPPIAYCVESVYARTSLTVSILSQSQVVPQVSASQSGPWSSSVNLGSFAAGQVKTFYVQFTVGGNLSPGAYNLTLQGVLT